MRYERIADNEIARQVAEVWNRDFKDIRKGRFVVYGTGNPEIFIEDCLDALKMHLDSKDTSSWIRKIFKPLNFKITSWSASFSKGNKMNISVFLTKDK